MWKILATLVSAAVIMLAGQTVAKAGPYDCSGAPASATNVAPHAMPEAGTAAAPADGQRYSAAPAQPQTARMVPSGRAYSYAPGNAVYSPMASVRPGQTMFTFGQRPAASKALGNY